MNSMTTSTTTNSTTPSRDGTSMSIDLSDFRGRVDALLSRQLRDESQRWSTTGLAAPAFDAIADLVARGGKRVRPCFVALGWAAAGGDTGSDRPVMLGAAAELLHVSALLHDDVVDGSPSRRGAPTAQVAAAERHRRDGSIGDADAYGRGLAILAGDVAMAIADGMVVDSAPVTRAQWQAMKTEVAVGQVLDHRATAMGTRDDSVALEVMRLKTSQYTVVRPLLVGAAEASESVGAIDVTLASTLTAFGEAVGEAFQLRDDILGAFGDEATTGKPVGADLREGKPTLLLAIATARATHDQRGILSRVGSNNLDTHEIMSIADVIRTTGALDAVEQRVAAKTAESAEILAGSSVRPDARDALQLFADTLMSRVS